MEGVENLLHHRHLCILTLSAADPTVRLLCAHTGTLKLPPSARLSSEVTHKGQEARQEFTFYSGRLAGDVRGPSAVSEGFYFGAARTCTRCWEHTGMVMQSALPAVAEPADDAQGYHLRIVCGSSLTRFPQPPVLEALVLSCWWVSGRCHGFSFPFPLQSSTRQSPPRRSERALLEEED